MSTEHDRHLEELPPHDELDALLRVWHDENAHAAASARAQTIARLRLGLNARGNATSLNEDRENARAPDGEQHHRLPRFARQMRFGTRAPLRAAASLALLITAIAMLIPLNSNPAIARQEIILVPDGGKLEARDARGQVIGPCALRHTDVHADIAGPFSRVTVKQQYHNPYPHKIEAVYTFPLSHRAAVDRMTMTIGDRIIVGEVKEREQARQMYESARSAGHVASLLEQERPNIFTQSVANIEPNADVLIEISYIEMLQQRDGEYTFDFPMVVAPRYIPGSPIASLTGGGRVAPNAAGVGALPNELERRDGLILLGPATFERQKVEMLGEIAQGNVHFNKTPLGAAPYFKGVIDAATPILTPDGAYRAREDMQALYRANPNYDFDVLYADGTREFGQIAGDGLGHINGRWFYFDPAMLVAIQRDAARESAAFAENANQVPDASRITPMPVRPPTRAGHDISLTVKIDTGAGGPAIIDWKSDLHEIVCTDPPSYRDLGNKINLALKNQSEIPNRDFVLRWRCVDDAMKEAVFTHAAADIKQDKGTGFFTAVIAPPAKVAPEQVLPRELIFVLDTSGSMSGFPIEKAKAVMAKAIDAMRPGDAFNMITFSGDTRILWKSPRANTEANRNEAHAFLAAQSGNGGTEMMTAINAALSPTKVEAFGGPQALTGAQLADLPADGREVVVRTRLDDIEAMIMKSAVMQPVLRVRDDLTLKTTSFQFPVEQMAGNPLIELRGKWSTINGERTFEVANAQRIEEAKAELDPLRIVMFLTDGQVGNDDAIIAAVRENSKTTRVFSFGIGDSPNRFLLDGIAQAGRGESTYVNLQNDPDAAVQAFAKRIESPVLRDIHIAFSGFGDDVEVFDTIPALDSIPDVWDVKPLIVHGRYALKDGDAHAGKITITGRTATGDYTRVIDVAFPARDDAHAMLPALWARGRIDQVLAADDNIRRGGIVQNATDATKREVIALGERYGITSAFTSFVAIEKTRVTIAGQPMLVPIPIELPSGMDWDHIFGGDCGQQNLDLWQAARDADPGVSPADVFNNDGSLKDPSMLGALAGRMKSPLVIELKYANAAALAEELNELLEAPASGIILQRPDVGEVQTRVPQVRVAAVPNTNSLAVVVSPEHSEALRNMVSAFDAAPRFHNAPGLDLEAALDQNKNARGLNSTYGLAPATARDGFAANGDMYFMQAQQQLGEIDPASLGRLGLINVNSSDVRMLGDLPIVGSQFFDTIPSDDTRNAAISFGWQSVQAPPPPPPPPPGDQGGGFGGGGGTGGGGSIFGEAGDDPERFSTVTESQEYLLEIVKETINPEGWSDFGGDLTEATIDNGVLNFRTLKDTPAAHATIDRARGLVTMLTAAIPEVAPLARIDAPPSKPFDPATDLAGAEPGAAADDADLPPQLTLVVYDVRDLIAEHVKAAAVNESDAMQQVIDVIIELVAPDAWNMNGGDRGRMQALKGNLIVTCEPENHRAIEDLLTEIRAAIGARAPDAKPAEGEVFKGADPVEAIATSRRADDPIVLAYDVRAKVSAWNATSNPPLSRRDALQTVVNAIQENIDPEGWRELGGDTGTIREIADVLVVLTQPRHHREIEGLLVGWTTESKGEAKGQPTAPPNPKADAQDQAKRNAETQAMIAKLKREDRLRRVIDQLLWPTTIDVQDAAAASESDAVDRSVVIVVLIDDANDKAAIEQLTSLGMRIDDVNASLNLIAGEIEDARKLVDVALIDGVRRIEPVAIDR